MIWLALGGSGGTTAAMNGIKKVCSRKVMEVYLRHRLYELR